MTDKTVLPELYIVLDDVKYFNNVGPVFRIADAIQAKKVYFCRHNAKPLNQGKKDILKKTSRGTFDYVPWEMHSNTVEVVKSLKEKGIHIVSVDLQATKDIFSKEIEIKFPVALVFGSESVGVNPEIVSLSDEIVKIPMYGQCESLNIASSVAILAYKTFELSKIK